MNKYIFLFTLLFLSFVSCSDDDCTRDTNCSLSPEMGPCEAAISRYYYDPIDGKCKEFLWGGCDGVVPFDELIACENACDCE